MYIVGGDIGKEVVPREKAEKIIGSIEKYDSKTKTFKSVSSFPCQRKGFSAALIPGTFFFSRDIPCTYM
jgi:hypothetical protein